MQFYLDYAIKMYGKYSSDEETVTHDGTILSKMNVQYEDIKCKAIFDLTIELVSGTKYMATVKLDVPYENILSTGKSKYEKMEFRDIIFKRS